MKSGLSASVFVFLTLGLSSVCIAQNWQQFFVNQAGYAFFFDKDSIAFPGKNTVQVWYKSTPTDDAETKVWVEWLELREVDCTRRRYKTLQGRVIYEGKPMETLRESSWTYLEPGQLEDTFYRTVCTQRKKGAKR
jgi:hypothetical protein